MNTKWISIRNGTVEKNMDGFLYKPGVKFPSDSKSKRDIGTNLINLTK